MIVKALGELVYGFLNLLFFFELPQIPDSVISIWNQICSSFGDGLDMLHVFIGDTAFAVVGTLLKLIVAVNVTYFAISLVFWIIKKIPMLNVRE